MKQSFEVLIKDFATSVIIERDTETSDICVSWYNVVNGQKVFRKKTCEEQMSEYEFEKYKNFLKRHSEIIEL